MVRLTRWTMRHRWLVLVAWIALAAGLVVVSFGVGTRQANNFALSGTDSQRAVDLLQNRFPAQAGDSEQIVFHSRRGTLRDPAVRAEIEPMLDRVAALPHVTGVLRPYAPGAHAVSAAGTIGFATVEMDQNANQLPTAAVDRLIQTATAIRSPALQV